MPYPLTESQMKARQAFLDEIHKKNRYIPVTECPYCSGKNFTRISETNRRGLPSDIVICDSCDGCFKSSILTTEADTYLYESLSYVLRGKDTGGAAIEKTFWQRVETFAHDRYYFISHFINLEPEKDLIVEFGCNDGANLFPWFKNGFSVLGIELDRRMVEFGQGKGLNLVYGDSMNYDFLKKPPKLTILSHALEHARDANAFLERLSKILHPEGFLFIEVPGIRAQGLVNTLKYFDIEHNYNFDLNSLKRILKKHQLKIIYADEYMRVLCTPSRARGIRVDKPITFSMAKIKARLLKYFMGCMNFKNKKMIELLKGGGNNDPRIRIYNKLQTLYFRYYYMSIGRPGEKNEKYKQ